MAKVTAAKLKQPPVFNLSFLTAMFERFGFYSLTYILVMYAESQFGFNDAKAFLLYGVFNGLVFLTPTIGGYLADNFLGIKRSIIVGLILESLGLAAAAFPSKFMFMLALGLIIVGVGFFKTAPTNLLGRGYKKDDPRIDSGFTLFYMAMNIGSLVASFIIGSLQKNYGWGAAFGLASVMIAAGLGSYFMLRHRIGDLDSAPGKKKLAISSWVKLSVGIVASILLCTFLVNKDLIADMFFAVVTLGVLGYFGFEIWRSKRKEQLRILACLSLIAIGFVFFVLYHQCLTSVELFIDRAVNHLLICVHVPTIVFLGLNSLWVIALGPILTKTYGLIARKRGKDLAVTTKFPIGLLSISACFFWLVLSTHFVNVDGKIASWWMIGFFGLFTLGEMLVSALGVAMVTHIAPKRMYGVTMGTWFLGVSLAGPVAGWVAGFANASSTLNNHVQMMHVYAGAFMKMGMIGLVCAILAFLIGPYIKRIAQID